MIAKRKTSQLGIECGKSGSADPAKAPDPDAGEIANLQALSNQLSSLTFTTSSSVSTNTPPDVNVMVNDSAKVLAVYQATLALSPPPFGDGVHSCPLDWGITYHLAFTTQDGSAVEADVAPSGCRLVHVNAVMRWADESYFAALADALSIPESKIFPYRPPATR